MTETQVEKDVLYVHERYGEVLVTGIAKLYGKWDTDCRQNDIGPDEVVVYFYDDYDGYGGLNPMPFSEPVNEFAKSVERLGPYEYTGDCKK